LLVIDGRVAFTGGAGVADQWLHPHNRRPAWRDTMARIEGPVVAALQGVFAENWLECCGEILTSPRHWPPLRSDGPTEAMLVKSSPSDRSTASRVVFQMLIEGAVGSIDIQTSYPTSRCGAPSSARPGVASECASSSPVSTAISGL
jgi:cardiolipin synthase